ncbi:MAG: hypothetical protein J6Q53_04225 [Oscillospiraceae bacterium]|nr:hypothetical protein [Oscillospiraceae bacterium]
MTTQEATKIKKVLKKENAVFTATAGYYDGNELRVKVIQFIERSKFEGAKIEKETNEQKGKKTRANIIKVLRALEKNGLRPEYRIEQRETTDAYGTWDCRYIIFK